MKRLAYITAVILSLLIIYSGAGVSIVHYCCSRCETVQGCCADGCPKCKKSHTCDSKKDCREKGCTATIYKPDLMKHISRLSIRQQELVVEYIDRDSEAYDHVFGCFKLPKSTDEEKAARSAAIQEATRFAALVPMQVARNACELMEIIADVARLGNQNAITDACVAMMAARSAGLGALLNVRINLGSLKDITFVDELKREADHLEQLACMREKELLEVVNQELNQ